MTDGRTGGWADGTTESAQAGNDHPPIRPSDHPTMVSRREAVELLSAAAVPRRPAAAPRGRAARRPVRARAAGGLRDGAGLRPKFFTAHEWQTVRLLVDLVLPKDERSGSATDAGVPEFMDFILVEYPDNQLWMRGGLAWLDIESHRRFASDVRGRREPRSKRRSSTTSPGPPRRPPACTMEWNSSTGSATSPRRDSSRARWAWPTSATRATRSSNGTAARRNSCRSSGFATREPETAGHRIHRQRLQRAVPPAGVPRRARRRRAGRVESEPGARRGGRRAGAPARRRRGEALRLDRRPGRRYRHRRALDHRSQLRPHPEHRGDRRHVAARPGHARGYRLREAAGAQRRRGDPRRGPRQGRRAAHRVPREPGVRAAGGARPGAPLGPRRRAHRPSLPRPGRRRARRSRTCRGSGAPISRAAAC